MAESEMKKSVSFDKTPRPTAAEGEPPKNPFRTTKSSAELAVEGYAEPGLGEHKGADCKHLDPYWHKGYEGLRPEDVQDEKQRLHELEQHQNQGMAVRAKDAMASAVAPSYFKKTKSAAEMVYDQAEGYADPGLSEHKGAEGKHLDPHWRKGFCGLRPEGEDVEEEEARLRELQQHQEAGKGFVEWAKESVSAATATAAETAGAVLQAAKEMVGGSSEK